ncbi:hypothetical protein [Microvirga roseola]|uniref:hypothetical protein n=1 Tax=Microvirga roseola TaxID=2883126 RepID=UPI001E3F26BC|nr:hypothetical protein [Microvirga roseola]
MAQFPIVKSLAKITVTRVDGEYQIRMEDRSGDVVVYHAVSEQVLDLADHLDDLLTEEEEEQAER